ncbi:hypothetical protein HGRIS_002126 [Hohenbuehelia grisea]|uniref:Uncharacterized protein n=1 Tax=Hohenbuehelia grisea TaxID=104357 RepID=A0ABR3JK76_9AGAR
MLQQTTAQTAADSANPELQGLLGDHARPRDQAREEIEPEQAPNHGDWSEVKTPQKKAKRKAGGAGEPLPPPHFGPLVVQTAAALPPSPSMDVGPGSQTTGETPPTIPDDEDLFAAFPDPFAPQGITVTPNQTPPLSVPATATPMPFEGNPSISRAVTDSPTATNHETTSAVHEPTQSPNPSQTTPRPVNIRTMPVTKETPVVHGFNKENVFTNQIPDQKSMWINIPGCKVLVLTFDAGFRHHPLNTIQSLAVTTQHLLKRDTAPIIAPAAPEWTPRIHKRHAPPTSTS